MLNKKDFISLVLLLFLSLFIFRDYFLKNQVPFPANLLIAVYQPWASYQWEGYPNGPPTKPIGFDNLRIFYPFRKITIEQIKNFQWPLWNPYVFSGNPLLASYQSAVFHPLSLLFFILPQIDAWSIIVILQPFLAGIFMYLFLREVDLSRRSSFFGAIVFAFSGFMIVWMEESFYSIYSSLFLPLVLYAIEKIFKKISATSFIILLFGLSSSVLSGWFQMTLYVWLFAGMWALYRLFNSFKVGKNPFVLICIAYVLSLAISAIHLVPSFEAFSYSARGTTDAKFIFDLYLQPMKHLVTLIAPDFFGNPASYNYFDNSSFYHEKIIFVGIPALFFVFYQLTHLKKLDYKEKFFRFAWPISLSLGFALPTSWLMLYNLKLPFISTIVPSRIFFVAAFTIAVLSAFGIERYLKMPDRKKLAIASLILTAAFIVLWTFVLQEREKNPISNFATISLRNLVLPSIIFVVTIILSWAGTVKIWRNQAYIAILLVALLSSLYFANKYLYFSDRRLVFPQVPVLEKLKNIAGVDRFLAIGDGYVERNLGAYYNLFSPEGYDSLYIRRYGEFLYAAQFEGKFSQQIPRTDAVLSQPARFSELTNDRYRKRLLSLMGIRYIVEKRDVVKERDDVTTTPIWQDPYFSIYEYEMALPRAFLANDYIVLKDNQEILDKIFDDKIDLSKTVILEEEPANISGETEQGSVQITSYTANEVILTSKSDNNSLLFLSDNYYPGWKVFVDSQQTKIYRANYSFRALVVPEGTHQVTFKYQPYSFYAGMITTFLGVLTSLLICIKIRSAR